MGLQRIGLSFMLMLAALTAGFKSQAAYRAILPPNPFIFGAQIDPQAGDLDLALNAAVGMELGWVSAELDWSQSWASPQQPAEFDALLETLSLANDRHLKVLVNLSNPPSWALTENGPDTSLTAELLLQLVAVDPGSLAAVELFPAANTLAGWGAVPNPTAYAHMINALMVRLAAETPGIILIPSVQPLQSETASFADLDDRLFLKALYMADPSLDLSIIGLHYSHLGGEPLSAPAFSQPTVLRHYELLRDVMVEQKHQEDHIWITSFSWPAALSEQEEQAAWAAEAFSQLRAQPFLDAAFFTSLTSHDAVEAGSSVLLSQGNLHPAGRSIARLNASHVVVFGP